MTGTTSLGASNLLLIGLASILAGIGAAGWWVSAHQDETRRLFRALTQHPRALAFRRRRHVVLGFLLARLKTKGAAGLFLTAGLLALAASATAFGVVLQDVVAHEELATFDTPLLRAIAARRLGWLTLVMRWVWLLTNPAVVVLVVLVGGLILYRQRRHWQPLLILAAAAAGSALLSEGVRVIVARPRPPAAFMAVAAHGYGFPSARAAQSALYGALAYLAAAGLPAWQAKVRVWIGAAVLAFLVGASPVYLGTVWPTDSLAGWAVASGWLAVVFTTTTSIRRLRPSGRNGLATATPGPVRAEAQTEPLATPSPSRPRTRPAGLRASEVAIRIERGQVNRTKEQSSRSLGQILKANIVTRFNALLGTLALVIALTGSLKDALFSLVLVANTAIGIIQELRSKATLDRLVVLAAPTARVLRDGEVAVVPADAVVLDDIIELRSGDQVPVDGVVLQCAALEVDESLITGEAEAIPKGPEDGVLSGSFAVAGTARIQATRVGPAAYAHRLAAEGRRFSAPRSPLRTAIDRLLAYVTWALVPTAAFLFAGQLRGHIGAVEAVRSSVAGVVGMVPEGLVLLASTAMALSVVRLARQRVLIQELPAVEGLARVDVFCCDKTGTMTDGAITLDEVLPAASTPGVPALASDHLHEALGALAAAGTGSNATLAAVGAACPPPGDHQWTAEETVAFSSARKWSGARFSGRGTWVLGAPEIVLGHLAATDPTRLEAARLAAQGRRVVALAHTEDPLAAVPSLPGGLIPAGLVVLSERIRPEAAATFAYFAEQGVAIKVISGDNPDTVAAVARAVGLPGAGTPQDARELPTDPDVVSLALEAHSVFGRVTPRQKRDMVLALRRSGHVVAMTGDGVNDVLALKEADLGIAMGSGSAAAKAVAKAILLDNDFSVLPSVVAEGRRVIANMERTASLFITKTVYIFALALAIGGVGVAFPFLPRHLTLAGSLTIGIPGFFLALEPNHARARPGFLARILHFAIPAGSIAAAATLAAYASARQLQPADLDMARTAATITLTAAGLSILALLAPPRVHRHWLILAGLGASLLTALLVPGLRRFFGLELPTAGLWIALVLLLVTAHGFLRISSRAALSGHPPSPG